MQGFVRVSSYLLQHLRAQEFTLYYTIDHFNITKNFCYASASTLMRMSGIRDKRVYVRAINTLLKGGLIARHNRVGGGGCVVYQSLYPTPGPEGFPVRKSFLFDETFKPKQKVIAIGRLVFKALTAKAMSKRLSISVSSIEHAVKIEADQVTILFKNVPQKTQGSNRIKRTTRNALIKPQVINYSEYVNLLGDKVEAPKETNPVVTIFTEDKEKKEGEEQLDKLRRELTARNTLNLFADAPKYLMLFEDLKRLFPHLSEEALTQAVWHTREKGKAGKISTGTPMAYAIGILRQFIRDFKGQGKIPTIESVDKLVEKFKQKGERVKAKQEAKKRVEQEYQESDHAYGMNKTYWESKSISDRELIVNLANKIINPAGLEFITESFTLKSFMSMGEMVSMCEKELSIHAQEPAVLKV